MHWKSLIMMMTFILATACIPIVRIWAAEPAAMPAQAATISINQAGSLSSGKTQLYTGKVKILNSESSAKSGSTLRIRYRSLPNIAASPSDERPELDVFNVEGLEVVTDVKMKEVDKTGIYEYDLTFDPGWGMGDFTLFCSDTTTGQLDSITLTITEPVRVEVSSKGAETAEFSAAELKLSVIQSQIDGLVTEMGKAENLSRSFYEPLSEISSGLMALGTVKGNEKFAGFYQILEDRSSDRAYLREKLEELKAVLELTRSILSAKKESKPEVILPRFRANEVNVTVDIFVANLSNQNPKEIEVKVDLPPELGRSDILAADGLELGVDPEKKNIFVKGKASLPPEESKLYEILVRDVWKIAEPEMRALGTGLAALRISKMDKEFQAKRQEALVRLDALSSREKESLAQTIDLRMAAYREHKKELEEIRRQFTELEDMISAKQKEARRKWLMTILITLFTAAAAFAALMGSRKLSYGKILRNKLMKWGLGERRASPRVYYPEDVKCELLASGEGGLVGEPTTTTIQNISERGLCLALAEVYSPESVLEIKIKFPSQESPSTFRGSVIWQKKMIDPNKNKEIYLTGVMLGEANPEDFQKLKEYTQARLGNQKRGFLKWLSIRSF